MPKDRLAELQSKRDGLDQTDEDCVDLNITMTLPGFFEKVSKVDELLTVLKSEVQEVRKIQKNVNVSPFVQPEEIKRMEMLGETVVSSSIHIRREIEKLRDEKIETEAKKRLQMLQIDRLSQELRTTMNEFKANQADYLNSSKARISRQLVITGRNPADVHIDLGCDNPMVFAGINPTQIQKAKSDLQDLKDREEDFKNLERQIHEVNGLFREMHMLVSEQGEKINTIADHVDKAEEHVEKARAQLRKAEVYHKKSHRTCIILSVVVIVVLLIVILIILKSLNVI